MGVVEDLWAYLAEGTSILHWRTEFAGDRERVGVALSKSAQILYMLCKRISTKDPPHPMFEYELCLYRFCVWTGWRYCSLFEVLVCFRLLSCFLVCFAFCLSALVLSHVSFFGV